MNVEDSRPCNEGENGNGKLPNCYLIVHNVSKRHNIGTLARCATAFGVAEVCLVGSNQYNTFGSHGAAEHVAYRHFSTLPECCNWLRTHQGCKVLGIEIMDDAKRVQDHPFEGPTAFMLGNEGSGLSEAQIRQCDGFVYIPQYGSGTASLNVTVAASIVLHHFALWAGFEERQRSAGKFDVAERPLRTAPRGIVANPADLHAEREQRKANKTYDWADSLQGQSILDQPG